MLLQFDLVLPRWDLTFALHLVCINFFYLFSKINWLVASSVDAERAFSDGRLQINHLQHNMSSQTFKAQMALGSWARTPLYPGLSDAIKIITKASSGPEKVLQKGLKSDSESEVEKNDDDEFYAED